MTSPPPPAGAAIAHLHAGFERQKAGDLEGAEHAYRAAIGVDPSFHPGWANLGVVCRRLGRLEDAAEAYRKALSGAPDHAGLWGNLGNVLRDLCRHEDSIAALQRSLVLRPEAPQVWCNLAISLDEARRPHEALAALDNALKLVPDDPEALWLRCQIRLSMGDFSPAAWQGFESRWRRPGMVPLHGLSSAPRWQGGERRGRRLLVTGEQGFGDTLLATRFLRRLDPADGEQAFLCQPALRRLLAPAVEDLGYTVHDTSQPVPAHDLVVSLMDLIGLYCHGPDQIPPPLKLAPAAAVPAAQPLLAITGPALRVGIVWSGNVEFSGNSRRAVSLDRFLPLSAVPGVRLYSLQLGSPREELHGRREIVDLAPAIGDFADTAGLLLGLDLVIQTDSAVAHLAGTLGVPVWNLLQAVPYSLYLRDRVDCPWYPSMRFFRQPRPGDWDSVFAAVETALIELAGRPPVRQSS